MSLQVIKSIDGRDEYVLLPVSIYHSLQNEITACLKKLDKYLSDEDYVDILLRLHVSKHILHKKN